MLGYLTDQGRSFNFTLNIDSSFSFSLDTRANPILPDVAKKKLSPSALRRNTKRREEFLKRRLESAKKVETHLEVEKSSQVKTFQCDQCDQSYRTENKLNIHIGKTHKDKIPQLDGFIEKNTAESAVQTNDCKKLETKDKVSQTEEVNEKKAETHTDHSDVTVEWGDSDKITLPPGTVVLRYKVGPYLEVDYPVMSCPAATWVFHPQWGLGKYYEEDNDHISYKFKESPHPHTGGRKR